MVRTYCLVEDLCYELVVKELMLFLDVRLNIYGCLRPVSSELARNSRTSAAALN